MLTRLLNWATSNRATPTGETPLWRAADDVRLYAIGDIHGRDDLLAPLLAQIEADAETSTARRKILVFLGDLIDRGPASREVIERCMALANGPFECIFLCGNHEQLLLDVWAGKSGAISTFHRAGARATLISYGVDPDDYDRWDFAELQRQTRMVIPPSHIEFIRLFPYFYQNGDYLFVHAGIRPDVALAAQRREDMIWIRQDFTASGVNHGLMVVHGHSMSTDVELRSNRIGIDTGAYASDVLTSIVIEGDQYAFLSTRAT
jgi:serine/threonine protein phosphatase 1